LSRSDARDNALEALRKLRDARGSPVKIHHSTGRSLAHDGLATRTADGRWRSTEAGVAHIDHVERAEEVAATSAKCCRDEANRERRKKALAWIDLHARLTFEADRYAQHVIEALLVGERVRESVIRWKGDGDALVRAWAEAALDAIEELEEAQRRAQEAGGDIAVTYVAAERVTERSRRRRATVVREIAHDNVVSLGSWKEARA